MIKFTSIPSESFHIFSNTEFQDNLKEIYRSGNFVSWKWTERLEAAISDRINHKQGIKTFVISTSSGTESLRACLSYLKANILECPNQIVTSPFTFWATTEAIIRSGLNVWYNDISFDKCQISPKDFSVPVALWGERICEYSHKFVVEDCCQRSPVSTFNTCSFASCYSLFPSKPLGTCGDGGLVITTDSNLAEWVRSYRYHGFYMGNKNISTIISGTYRLSEINALYAYHKLVTSLDGYQVLRKENAKRYCKNLGINYSQDHDYHVFNVFVRDRGNLTKYLKEQDVGYGMHYPYTCDMHLRNSKYPQSSHNGIPNASRASRTCLSLPMHHMLTPGEIDRVCELVKNNVISNEFTK